MQTRFAFLVVLLAAATASADDVGVRGHATVGNNVQVQFSTGNTAYHGMSPYANTHHGNGTVHQHNYSQTTITPAPGQFYAHWGNGYILGGSGHGHRRGHYPHYPRYRYEAPRHVHGEHCTWVEGYYDTREEQVYVPAYYETQYVPAQYQTVDYHGRLIQIMVSPGRTEKVLVPARYETKRVRYWVPGRWSCGN